MVSSGSASPVEVVAPMDAHRPKRNHGMTYRVAITVPMPGKPSFSLTAVVRS